MAGEDSRVRIPAWLLSLLAFDQAEAKSSSLRGLWEAQGGLELAQLIGEY